MLFCNRCYLAQRPLKSLQERRAWKMQLIFVQWSIELNYTSSYVLYSHIFYCQGGVIKSPDTRPGLLIQGLRPCFCHLGELTKAALPVLMSASTHKMEVMMLISCLSQGKEVVQSKDEIILLFTTWILMSLPQLQTQPLQNSSSC